MQYIIYFYSIYILLHNSTLISMYTYFKITTSTTDCINYFNFTTYVTKSLRSLSTFSTRQLHFFELVWAIKLCSNDLAARATENESKHSMGCFFRNRQTSSHDLATPQKFIYSKVLFGRACLASTMLSVRQCKVLHGYNSWCHCVME